MRRLAPSILFVVAFTVGRLLAQTPPPEPASLANEELLKRTEVALRTLLQAEEAADADVKAFDAGTEDLAKVRAALAPALPDRPTRIAELPEVAPEGIEREAELRIQWLAAYRARKETKDRALALLDARKRKAAALVERFDALAKAASEARAVLIEVERRVGGGSLPPESVVLPPKEPDIAGWNAHAGNAIAAAAKRRGDAEVAAQAADLERRELGKLEAYDPEVEAEARREVAAAQALVRSESLVENEREALEKADAAEIPARLERIREDILRERTAYLAARDDVAVLEKELAELDLARRALVLPAKDSIPEGDGHLELRTARRNAEFSDRLLEQLRTRKELLTKALETAAKLKVAATRADEASERYLRQLARLRAAHELGEERAVAAGQSPPPRAADATALALFEAVRGLAVEEAARRDRSAAADARVKDSSVVKEVEAALDAERAENARLAAILGEEMTYAGHVQDMARKDDATLLGLVIGGGELDKEVDTLRDAAATAEERVQAAERSVQGRRSLVRSLENPYTQAEIRRLRDRAALLRNQVEGLREGKLPEDTSGGPRAEEAAAAAAPTEWPVAEAPVVEAIDALAQAQSERRTLVKDQAFAKELVRYFGELAEQTAALEAAAQELDAAIAARADALSALVNALKRRYAAAREVERRAIPRLRWPGELDRWMTRDAIRDAQKTRDDFVRTEDDRRARRKVEIERLRTILGWRAWADTWSEIADAKAALAAEPVRHLEAAGTAYDLLKDVEKKDLGYKANLRRERDDPFFDGILASFTAGDERARLREPLAAYYLAVVDSERIQREHERAVTSFEMLIAVCVRQQEAMGGMPAALRRAEDVRWNDYQVARYLAAISASPETLAALQSDFRTRFKRDLPMPVEALEGNRSYWADQLFAAEARLRGIRRWVRDMELLVSKLGIEAEIGRYRTALARVTSDLAAERARVTGLASEIEGLRTTYSEVLRKNGLRSLLALLVIPTLAWLLVRLIHRVGYRIESRTTAAQGEALMRDRRLRTLVKAGTAALSAVVWVIAGIYLLGRLGVDVTPIIASASVVGLAVAFGAQTLVKDFIAGFFILLENQYTLGDVVDLGGVSGVVEKMTLRVTTLRDLEGNVHYVPNSTLSRVANKTQDWSRAVLDVSVGYGENLERVTKALLETTQGLRDDSRFGHRMLDGGVVAGVEALGESGVTVRLLVKTRPGHQWEIGRELRGRIKQRFDADGIEIPFPQRVVRVHPRDAGKVDDDDIARAGA